MGILANFLGGKAVTSEAIIDEIGRAEADLAAANTQLSVVFEGIATMSDADHIKADTQAAVIRRLIARLEAKISGLHAELPAVQRAEKIAANTAADAALQKRAEVSRKAVNVEAAKLLAYYDELADQIADVLEKLSAIDAEAEVVNQALRSNPVAQPVSSVARTHRKHPDRPAYEKTERMLCWVGIDRLTGKEEVRVAALNADGTPIPVNGLLNDRKSLEHREVVVSRGEHRPGDFLRGLDEVLLPPGTIKSKWHWPRES